MPKPAKPSKPTKLTEPIPLVEAAKLVPAAVPLAIAWGGVRVSCVCCGNPVAAGATCPVDGTVA